MIKPVNAHLDAAPHADDEVAAASEHPDLRRIGATLAARAAASRRDLRGPAGAPGPPGRASGR
jgi:hypothetical protein